MSKPLEDVRNMSVQEAFQSMPLPDARMMQMDITWCASRIKAIEELLREKLGVDVGDKASKYWLEGVQRDITKK